MAVYDIAGVSLSSVYDVNGQELTQCYDIDGNALLPVDLIINEDASTGTSSGYVLTSAETANQYVMRMVVDFGSSGSLQSFCYDYDNERFYKFDASTTVQIYNSSLELIQTITLPQSAGHNNDSVYYDGKIYQPDIDQPRVYIWNISANTVSTKTITGIVDPPNGSTRECGGLCETSRGTGLFYIACRDVYTSDIDHQPGDKLSIYEWNSTTGVATLKAEFPWDCVYVQGATCLDGILYVTCNTQTTGAASNYTGITVKAIRTDTWELIDELVVSGDFEPEGLDFIPADGGLEIMMGMGRWSRMHQAVRFTIPYQLV